MLLDILIVKTLTIVLLTITWTPKLCDIDLFFYKTLLINTHVDISYTIRHVEERVRHTQCLDKQINK